jgi:hypothetical protein
MVHSERERAVMRGGVAARAGCGGAPGRSVGEHENGVSHETRTQKVDVLTDPKDSWI